MVPPTIMDVQMVEDLKRAIKECTERGLSVASKWASELYLSLPIDKRRRSSTSALTSIPAKPWSPPPSAEYSESSRIPAQSYSHTSSVHQSQATDSQLLEADLELQEGDVLCLARACFEAREFKRAVHILRECKSSKARFLGIYSQFIASEKRAHRDWHKFDNNRHQPPIPVNALLIELLDMVEGVSDPWLLFLKALFLARLSRREEAIEMVILSIGAVPWNWSAWMLLGSCIGDSEELSSLLQLLPLPLTHPMVQMFQIRTMSELHNPSEHELNLCDALLSHDYFPNSLWTMSLRACVLYHLHDFAQAELQFERILALDPYRVDDIDVFSNILYVTDNRLKLSKLAHGFLALDKDRPEVCCLVGNHYSLRAEHEKAVKYFRRATQLDRTYLSAWTLMGHEYVEMKNSHAAIEAYRRAVDVNRKDYRAWYGLGQAYELLSMHHYALHYYQHATALRPYDVRLWQAQGMCYEEIGRLREAIECLKHALIPADPHEITIYLKLAKLYQAIKEPTEAIAYHRRVVEICQADRRPIQDYAKSSLEVAEYQLQISDGDLALAHDYLEKVIDSNSEDVGRAAELLKKVKVAISKAKASEGPAVTDG